MADSHWLLTESYDEQRIEGEMPLSHDAPASFESPDYAELDTEELELIDALADVYLYAGRRTTRAACNPRSKFESFQREDQCFLAGGYFASGGENPPCLCANAAAPVAFDPLDSGCRDGRLVGGADRHMVIDDMLAALREAAKTDIAAFHRYLRTAYLHCEIGWCGYPDHPYYPICCQLYARAGCEFVTSDLGAPWCDGFNMECVQPDGSTVGGHRWSLVQWKRRSDGQCEYLLIEPSVARVWSTWTATCNSSQATAQLTALIQKWFDDNKNDWTVRPDAPQFIKDLFGHPPFSYFLRCKLVRWGGTGAYIANPKWCCSCTSEATDQLGPSRQTVVFYPEPEKEKGEKDGSETVCKNRCSAIGGDISRVAECPLPGQPLLRYKDLRFGKWPNYDLPYPIKF